MQKKNRISNKLEGNFRPGLTIIYIHFAKITIKNFKNISHKIIPRWRHWKYQGNCLHHKTYSHLKTINIT